MRDEHRNPILANVHIRLGIWTLCSLLALGFVVSQKAAATDTAVNSGDRLITVYDQGEEKTFVTNKTTVGAALRESGYSLSENDAVEPVATTKMVAKNYIVNIYRARSVIVEDEQYRYQVLTAEQSPRRILEKAGSKLYDEDEADFELADKPLTDGGAGVKLKVDRATPFMLKLYGKRFEARSQAETVGEMLKEKGVVLGDQDGQSLPDNTPLTKSMEVAVWRNGKQTVTVEEAIVKPSEEIKDNDREIGYREVRTTGSDGKKNVTYEIDIRDGQEVARREIASVTTKEPIKEVIAVGAKPKVYTGSHADWMRAAGITPGDFNYVEKLIAKESGWNPNAMNASSGACGLVQALPCSKLGPNWNDPVVALKWGDGYVKGRYGGWAGAWAHSQSRGWY